MDVVATLSMKFEYCENCVEQLQLIYTVTGKPRTTFQQSVTKLESHNRTIAHTQSLANHISLQFFFVPWYAHND